MKILFIARSTLYSVFGGDTVQMMKTAKFLKISGVEVDIIASDKKMNYDEYDLIHFFNIIRPADMLYHIKKSNLPFVISPVYVDYSEYEKQAPGFFKKAALKFLSKNGMEYLKVIARRIVNGGKINSWEYLIMGHKNSIQKLLKKTSMLLPNSANEYNRLQKDFGIHSKYKIVYNAVDQDDFERKDFNAVKREGVICVGRIEGRKNQLNLIRAMNDSGISLVIIGNPAPNHLRYFEQCKKEAGPNITFIDFKDQQELKQFYAKSKVHVLPSWFETCGLSTMEAAVMGCNVVITNKGDTPEYFGEDAFYCEPGDVNSIKEAIVKAYHAPFNENLRKRIIENFTWENAAQETLEAYKEVLKLN